MNHKIFRQFLDKMTLIKSISGIRGTIGGHAADNLTPIDVVKFTTAYARLIKDKNPGKRITVVVGRDARLSGSMVDSLVEGTLLGTGVDVINVGLCTTPGTEMAVITHKADGGIIITASHNPRQWNALKLLNERGEFLDDAEGKQVLAMAEDTEYSYPTIDHIGKVVLREDFNQKHIEQVLALKLVDKEAACVFAMFSSAICLLVCIFAKSFKYRENTHTIVPFLYQIGTIDISNFFCHINK